MNKAGLARYRCWALASASEVALARLDGEITEAAQLAQDAAAQSRAWASRWQRQVLADDDCGGVFRFAHSRFQKVPTETRERLLRMSVGSEPDRPLEYDERAGLGSRLVAEREPALGAIWFERQHALAGVLDLVEETTERLESLAAESSFCQRRRLAYEQWEGLPAPVGDHGLGIIVLPRGQS